MTSETLRRAAALMRERATAVSSLTGVRQWRASLSALPDPGRERDWLRHHVATDDVHGSVVLSSPWPESVAVTHAASWHPLVALAVADWLDSWADHAETADPDDRCGLQAASASDGTCNTAALAVARAYLGEAS